LLCISADPDKKAMWEAIRPVLRSPIIKIYTLKERPSIPLPLSGMTALAHYSMLDDGAYPVYAAIKMELSELNTSAGNRTPAGEAPGCIVHELGYRIAFQNEAAVDPLTVALTLTGEELADPRIGIAVDKMLEEHVWSRDSIDSGSTSAAFQITTS